MLRHNLLCAILALSMGRPGYQTNVTSPSVMTDQDKELNYTLDFSKMGVTHLKKSSTNYLVTHIYLTNNNIWKIDDGTFESFPNLIYLNLTGNLIPLDELNFFEECKIEVLVLDRAIMRGNIEGYTCCEKSREKEDIRHYWQRSYAKDVVFKPAVSMKLKKLRSLYLRNNNIKDVELDHLTLLKEIMPSLAYLYLDNNRISSVNFVEFLPPTLTHLYLTNNNISKFKSRFLRNLKLLMLDRNPIKHLCGSKICNGLTLNSAVNLQVLSLSRIELQDVQVDSFRDLEHLLFLDLSHNEIYQIPDHTFDNLPNLRILHLDHNELDTVPDTCGLKNLEYLSIAFNRIKAIDTSMFCGLPKLAYLNMSSNILEEINPEVFGETTIKAIKVADPQNNWELPEMDYSFADSGKNSIESFSLLLLFLIFINV